MKPFFKWAGGKYKIIDKIKASLPIGDRLVEPFAGSGAVFINTEYKKYIIADSNADLINVFVHVQREVLDFIFYVKQLFVKKNNQEDAFYCLREEFNLTNDARRKAALFIYLNRHCFNGLCRYNSKGGFNVPFGRYVNPMFPEKEMFNFFKKSQFAEFRVADFVKTMLEAELGDVVYCDPPYVPLTLTSKFTSYTQDGFGLDKQKELANMAKILMKKGIPVIISNHDTDFTRSIYSAAKIQSFDVQRFISSDAANRNKVSELLVAFS